MTALPSSMRIRPECRMSAQRGGTSMDLLERMLGHDRWTTEQLLTPCQRLSDVHLDREFDIGHRTLRKTFDHMVLVVDFWTGQMVGHPVPYEPAHASVAEMLTRHARSYDQFEKLARDLVASSRRDETGSAYPTSQRAIRRSGSI